MTQLFANNAYSSLASNASNSTTTLTLTTGTGARFPSPTGGNYFLLTLVGLDSNANESSWEIVKVTARSTDTLTVVRAQESTTAVAWSTGTRVESRATAGTFSDWDGNTLPIGVGGTGATTASAARTSLGLAIGTNVQAWDADLDAIAALAGTSGLLKKTAANTWTLDTTTYESTANKGAANGYAPLGSDSKIASAYLPSYVDDVVEGANLAAFPGTGETGKIYVALDTNKTYRWSGSAYVEISPSPGSTDSVTEGSVNLYFTNARAVTALSGTLASYAPLASPTFTGSIKGDFSNATASSRVSFQTSTANSSTIIGAKPSGTGTASYLQSFNASDADNAGYVYLGITGTAATINSAKTGTGTALPLTLSVNSSEKMRIDTTGTVGLNVVPPTTTGAPSLFVYPDSIIGSAGGSVFLTSNTYYNTSFKAVNTGTAGSYQISGDTHLFFNAVSVAANAAQTFVERLRIGASGQIGIGGANYGTAGQVLTSGGAGAAPSWAAAVSLSTANTWTATQTFNGSSSTLAAVLANAAETVFNNTSTGLTGTITLDAATQSLYNYTVAATGNWTINIRASSGTSLNSFLAVGQSITVAVLAAQGATAYYNNVLQIDGATVTPKYQGGTAWSAGNASGIDAYVYTIIKTASATFTVIASQTQYK